MAPAGRWHSPTPNTKLALPTSPMTFSALATSEASGSLKCSATCWKCVSETKLAAARDCCRGGVHQARQQPRGRSIETFDIVVRPRDQHGSLKAADNRLR